MRVSVEDISTVDGDAEMMNATAARQQRPATNGSAPTIDPISAAGGLVAQRNTLPLATSATGDNLERQIVTMLTALVGLFVLMAIAWAVHDGQAALERQQDKHHND